MSTSILAACGASAANGSIGSSTSPTSSPSSGSPKPAASAAPSTAAGSSAANAGAAAVPSTWDELVAAAKSEGKVVVTGAPDTDTRQKLPAAFKDRFGIEVEYLPGATEVTARLQGERAAGQYTLDAEVNGSDSIYGTLLANGWLDPLKPALLMPEVADGSKWKTGSPWFRDPKGDTALQIFSTLSQNVTLNTDIVPASAIPTADALLDPQWKGKICAFDPGANGSGLAVGSALYVSKGEDWVTKLYKGQNVALSRDYNQLADWVAHGTYPIGVSVGANYLASYAKAGLHFDQPQLPDAPNSVGGGFGIVVVMNHAPHPNAARVFANWMASKEGLTLYSQTQLQAPVRNDIDPTWMPSYLIPKPGVKYLDTYEYNFETGQRLQIRDFYQKLLK
ncbi:MAG TPA: extracellular solute-binding protein [Chloroflexota bacterium]|nr:extracellular solute-binding protein [Chloroflexota bacterium]